MKKGILFTILSIGWLFLVSYIAYQVKSQPTIPWWAFPTLLVSVLSWVFLLGLAIYYFIEGD